MDVSILIATKNYFIIENQFQNFKNSSLDFEIIVVGPSNYKSSNKYFKFFESYCKPAQCMEIAIQKSSGDQIIMWADDIFFTNQYKKNLDILINFAKKNQRSLISLKLSNEINKNLKSYKYHSEIPGCPLLPIAAPINRKDLKKIKTIDKEFIATLYDIDIYMRLICCGYKTKFIDLYVKEKRYSNYSLNKDFNNIDRKYLDKLWTKKSNVKTTTIFGDQIAKSMRKKRLKKVLCYNREKLEIVQGRSGRWLLNNKVYYKYILSLYFLFFKIFIPTYQIRSYIYKLYRIYLK
jgi:hypothetical protein